jgi:glycerophosphoryl diester phosphodiesterase
MSGDTGMRNLALLLLSGLLAGCANRPDGVVIAHRGASGYLPEHTLEAKALAYGMGADFLEQDVVLSKDGVPVVFHDVQIDTTTDVATKFPGRKRADGRYYAIDFTVAELKTLRASERFDSKTGKAALPGRYPVGQGDFRVSTLEEELQFIQALNKTSGRKVGVYPELKEPAWHRKEGRDLSRAVLPILGKYGYGAQTALCYVQCFEYEEVKRVRGELGWKGRMILLLGGKKGRDGTDYDRLRTDAGLAELAKVVDGIGPSIGSLITGQSPSDRKVSDLVERAHAHGLKVHAHTLRTDELPRTVRDAGDLIKVLFDEAGVDGVFTDFPDVVARAVHAPNPPPPRPFTMGIGLGVGF